MEIDVVDEPSFCKACPRFELLPPLVDAILCPSPSVEFFHAHALFRALAGKDVGARFAFTLLEVVIQRATCFIHQVDCSFLATLVPNTSHLSYKGEKQDKKAPHLAYYQKAKRKNKELSMYRLREMDIDDKVCEQVSMTILSEVYPTDVIERCVQQSEPWSIVLTSRNRGKPPSPAGAQYNYLTTLSFPSCCVGRNQSETWLGCIVSWTTATSSSRNWFKSTSLRNVTLKAARIRVASYFRR